MPTSTAGTAWHFARDHERTLDYLFIDEAGQVSLADALAIGTSRAQRRAASATRSSSRR